MTKSHPTQQPISESKSTKLNSKPQTPLVLIVSRDGYLIEDIRISLEQRHGFRTIQESSTDGAKALIFTDKPDLILFDDCYGDCVCEFTNQRTMPVVIMTRRKDLLDYYTWATGFRAVSRTAPVKRICEHITLARNTRRFFKVDAAMNHHSQPC